MKRYNGGNVIIFDEFRGAWKEKFPKLKFHPPG